MSEENKVLDNPESKHEELEKMERAIDSAYSTGKTDRAEITKAAQRDAEEAVSMVGIAIQSDMEADDAMKIAIIAQKSKDNEKAKVARKKEREARKKANKDHAEATKAAKKAYDAIRFSAPNRMGLMRIIQILFALHIVVVILFLMITSRDAFAEYYNAATILDWIMVVLEGVAFWMFINRYKIGRYFVIGMCIFEILAHTILDLIIGQFSIINIFISGIFDVVLLLYFLFSARVKATLVNDIGTDKGDYEKGEFIVDRKGFPFIRNLIIYFIVFSVLGHWMEMGMCQLIILKLVQGDYDPTNTMLWRDWLYPFPMEGTAVVVIALVLHPFFLWLKKKCADKQFVAYFISFLSGALLCTLIEFSMGLIVNDHYQLWDYRKNFGNIMGQVCLQNTMAFGVVAAIITWWVYPLLERWIARVPQSIMNIIAVVIIIFGATIFSLYIIEPPEYIKQRQMKNASVYQTSMITINNTQKRGAPR
ncbi:MAG: hypothetical protein IK054_08045 [Lachnospiraceae bacterium]|nr:hypothetical protein [Lachnospiraceae bacterium]